MKRAHDIFFLGLAGLLALGACGDKDDGDGSSDGESNGGASTSDGGSGEGDCSDPDVNVFAGTCVETFLAGCFDPSGACEGTIDMTTGSTTMTWANGATIETEVDTSNPTSPSVTTSIYASDGTLCAVGESQNGVGGCASQTVYERQSDGATQTWCIQADGSMEVSCSDGTSVSVSASEAEAANSCGFASDAEPCEFSF